MVFSDAVDHLLLLILIAMILTIAIKITITIATKMLLLFYWCWHSYYRKNRSLTIALLCFCFVVLFTGAVRGFSNVGYSDLRLLHINLRLAALRRSAIGPKRQMLRSIHGRRLLQLLPTGRLLLDYTNRHVRLIRGYIPRCFGSTSPIGREETETPQFSRYDGGMHHRTAGNGDRDVPRSETRTKYVGDGAGMGWVTGNGPR